MLAIANSYVFSAQMTLWIKSKRHDSIIFLYTGILPALGLEMYGNLYVTEGRDVTILFVLGRTTFYFVQ